MVVLTCCSGQDCMVLEENLSSEYILVKKGNEYIIAFRPAISKMHLTWESGTYVNSLLSAVTCFNKKCKIK